MRHYYQCKMCGYEQTESEDVCPWCDAGPVATVRECDEVLVWDDGLEAPARVSIWDDGANVIVEIEPIHERSPRSQSG